MSKAQQGINKGDAVRGKDQSVSPTEVPDLTLNIAEVAKAQREKPQLKLVKAIPEYLEKLIEVGIPIRKAVFHRTVIFDYAGGTPESAYYSPDWSHEIKKHKQARMWYTPHGLVCEQGDVWKIVPLANVSDTCI